jgi:chromosome segregation ATPase
MHTISAREKVSPVTTIQTILAMIRGKSMSGAAEMRDALSRIDIPALERDVDDLEAIRRRLLVEAEGDEQLLEIEARLATANRDVERGIAAKAELERRIAEAETAEKIAEVEHRMDDERTAAKQLLKAYVTVDKLASQLAQAIKEVDEGERRITQANVYADANGRVDLRIPRPMTLLQQHLGRPAGSIVMPRHIEGYLPPHPDVGLLGRMREIIIV